MMNSAQTIVCVDFFENVYFTVYSQLYKTDIENI